MYFLLGKLKNLKLKKPSMVIIQITISLIVIGLKKLLFLSNLLAKLLLDSLLSDSSISHSHQSFSFNQSTIQSCGQSHYSCM